MRVNGITFALGAAREIVLTELSRYYSSHMLADDDGPAPVAQASTSDVQYLALATMMDAAADHSPTIRVTDTSTLSDTMLAAYKQAYISFATLPNDKVILPRRGEGTEGGRFRAMHRSDAIGMERCHCSPSCRWSHAERAELHEWDMVWECRIL